MRSTSVAARGEHQHRQAGARAQVAAQRQAVLAGQHQVEHHEVDAVRLQRAPHRLAVGHGGDAIARLLKVFR
jgi:hypothetical protein